MRTTAFLLVSAFLVGCSSTVLTPIIKNSSGNFVISAEGVRDDSTPEERVAKIQKEAQNFCDKEKQVAEVINTNEHLGGFGKVAANGMTFRCINPKK